MTPRPTFDPGFSTTELGRIFSPEATVAAILEFESALARSLTEVGLAPTEETAAVIDACAKGVVEPAGILATTWESGTPLIALREEITADLTRSQASWFHYGATTQDAIDTGLMLQARRALDHIHILLLGLARALRDLTIEFRDQSQIGRTFLQDADPTVFGLRAAGWLDMTLVHAIDLDETKGGLAVQLGGSVGTLETYGQQGSALRAALASNLGLVDPSITWHGDRRRIHTLAHSLERTARSMSKIATDISLLSSSAVGEMSVRSGGSSSMPGKRNPIDSVRAISAAAACAGAVSMLTSAPSIELDRGVGGWHVEWIALPMAFQTAGASVEAMTMAVESIDLHTAAMENDVETISGAGAQAQIDTVLERASQIL